MFLHLHPSIIVSLYSACWHRSGYDGILDVECTWTRENTSIKINTSILSLLLRFINIQVHFSTSSISNVPPCGMFPLLLCPGSTAVRTLCCFCHLVSGTLRLGWTVSPSIWKELSRLLLHQGWTVGILDRQALFSPLCHTCSLVLKGQTTSQWRCPPCTGFQSPSGLNPKSRWLCV